MLAVMICEHMKWSYQEYASAPSWFLDRLEIKLNKDAQQSQKASK
jgi:hypothetical protein